MGIEVSEVDPHDEARLRAWWEVGRDASAERPLDEWPAWEVSRVALPTPNPEREVTLTVASGGGRVVGSGLMSAARHESPHVAVLDVYVEPGARRRGVGSALVADLEARAVGTGRTTLQSEAFAAGPLAFAARHGFEEVHTEDLKLLDVATYAARRPALAAEVAAHRADHRCDHRVTVSTRLPEEHLQGFADLLGSFYAQIPLGGLDVEDSEWTPERLRAWAERGRAVGREEHLALALAPDGTVVGASGVKVDLADPEQAGVGITVVAAEHRGHRLGLALKLATHDSVVAAHPGCRRFATSNAVENVAMSRVNSQLGYVAVETCHELQKVLGT